MVSGMTAVWFVSLVLFIFLRLLFSYYILTSWHCLCDRAHDLISAMTIPGGKDRAGLMMG